MIKFISLFLLFFVYGCATIRIIDQPETLKIGDCVAQHGSLQPQAVVLDISDNYYIFKNLKQKDASVGFAAHIRNVEKAIENGSVSRLNCVDDPDLHQDFGH